MKSIDIIMTGHSFWQDYNFQEITNKEVWTTSTLSFSIKPKKLVMFEVHDYYNITNINNQKADEVFMLKKDESINNVIQYPMQEVIDYVKTDYFRSTVSYVLALAIYKKIDEINLFGCDMEAKTEYASQAPALTYLIGFGRAKGLKININNSSPLLKTFFRYGEFNTLPILDYLHSKKKMIAERKRNATSEKEYSEWQGYELAIDQQLRIWH